MDSLMAKLKNNAVYGKTMENPAKYTTISTDQDAARFVRIGNDIISSGPWEGKHKQCPHIGFTILEDSKCIFYSMWHQLNMDYNINKIHGPEQNLELLYCDTDSMILHAPRSPQLWTSLCLLYPKLFNKSKDKILGMWENEIADGEQIEEVITLSAKQYAVKVSHDKHILKHKGVSKSAGLTWSDYENTLKDDRDKMIQQQNFKRGEFNVYTNTINKVGLSTRNNKRYKSDETYMTLPFGYKGDKYR